MSCTSLLSWEIQGIVNKANGIVSIMCRVFFYFSSLSHFFFPQNRSSYLDRFTLKEKVPQDDLFDINVNASKSTASLRDSSPVVDNNRHTAKFSPLVDFTKPKTRNHADSVTFQGSTRRQSAQGPTTLSKGSSTRDCTPRTNIVFFKMHKCSSSTVQNILLRYGEKHSLDFVLPPAGNYLGHSQFSRKCMLEFPVKEYNILCHHTMFDETGRYHSYL